MNNDFDIKNTAVEETTQQTKYVTYVPYGLTPETYEERKKVKKVANIIGGSLLIMWAISSTFVLVLRVILTALGLWGINAYNFITEPAFLQFLQAILSVILFTLPFVWLFKVFGFSISKLVKFKKPKKQDVLPFFLIGVSFCAFANVAVSYIESVLSSIFSSFGVEYNFSMNENPEGVYGFMLTFIATAIVPALVEEFACRGIILGSLRRFGDGVAIFCSAILFGVMHGNFNQMPFAFLVGLVLGYIVVKTNTIWIAVAVHCYNNAFSVIFDYATEGISQLSQNSIFAIYELICLLLGVLGIYLLKNRDDVYGMKKAKTKAKLSDIYKWFFSSPTIIIFIILSVVKAFSFFEF